MRLVHLCDMTMGYEGAPVMVRPYGNEEGTGFGVGAGVASGERLHGTVRWFNYPHRRSDGVMLPNISGMVTTDDGAIILFTMQGRTLFTPSGDGSAGSRARGSQMFAVFFEAEDQRFRWLNTAVCVMEGVVSAVGGGPPSQNEPGRVYICENELLG
ncbi:MAG: DUF3237 family protein [Ktedonobacterales bacterium]